MSIAITEEATSKFASLNINNETYKIHYNDCGTGDKVVVMLHGSGPGASGWANFNRNVEPLVSAGYRVILMDCLGWSKSDSIVCATSRSHLNADTLYALLQELAISKVDIIGNSMGGHSAAAFALQFPEYVGKLVLMGGGTGGASIFTPMPAEGIKLLQGLYRNPTIENLKAMMNVFVFDPSALTEELYQARLKNILAREDHLENFVKSFQVNPKQFPDISPDLPAIKAPTLVMWGRQDRFVPMDTGLRLVAGIPNSELHLFNQCGHWVQWEYADRFNAMVLQFLAD